MIQIAICDDDAVMLTEMQSVITQHMEQKNLNYRYILIKMEKHYCWERKMPECFILFFWILN